MEEQISGSIAAERYVGAKYYAAVRERAADADAKHKENAWPVPCYTHACVHPRTHD